MDIKVKARPECFDLPHLCGFWIEPCTFAAKRGEETRNLKRPPAVLLFFGEDVMVRVCPATETATGKERLEISEWRYRIDGADLRVRKVLGHDGNKSLLSEGESWPWSYLDVGMLSIGKGDQRTLYAPAELDEILAAGYRQHKIFVPWALPTLEDGGEIFQIMTEAWMQRAIARKRWEQVIGLRRRLRSAGPLAWPCLRRRARAPARTPP